MAALLLGSAQRRNHAHSLSSGIVLLRSGDESGHDNEPTASGLDVSPAKRLSPAFSEPHRKENLGCSIEPQSLLRSSAHLPLHRQPLPATAGDRTSRRPPRS